MIFYTIPLDTRTKKNHMTIAGTGRRCPVCGKPARQYVRQGKSQTDYALRAAPYLSPRPAKPIPGPVKIVYRVYMATRRRVDDLNLYASLDDLLVSEGILKDDNISVIRCRDGSFVSYDKQHPRAEIEIYGLEGDSPNG